MKRRLVSILLSLCFILTLLPAGAYAMKADMIIGDMGINTSDLTEITYWLSNGEGGIKTDIDASESNYNAKYEKATKTLTLKDLSITQYIVDYGIYATYDLNLVLIGTNTIGTSASKPVNAIFSDSNLSVSGSGTLNAISSEVCISATNSYTQSGATVNLSSDDLALTRTTAQ